MAFQLSPGINVSEIDLTAVVPAVATTEGAIAGMFRWGPVNLPVLVTSETELVTRFGKPANGVNLETFFTAADFLAYGNKLYVARAASNTAYNAGTSDVQVLTEEDALALSGEGTIIAKYPGAAGNSLKVSICQSANAYSLAIAGVTMSVGANTATVTDAANLNIGDILRVGRKNIGFQDLTVTNIQSTTVSFSQKLALASDISSANVNDDATKKWGYYKNVNRSPSANRIHVAIIDEDGVFSGVSGTVLEVFQNVSTGANAKNSQGASIYYKDVLNGQSAYVYATADNVATTGDDASYTSLTGGADGGTESNIAFTYLATAYDQFVNADEIEVSLVLQGKARGGTNDTQLANYIIENICEVRKDCMAFISPAYDDVVNNLNDELDDILDFRADITPSSYAVIDSGYKYRYDKYNDKYIYTPLNGDIAGLLVRTDLERDAWWSPAGYNRGLIKNVIKLAYNPNKAHRDILYSDDVNPVITQAGEGSLLFGDKTALGEASAFDRINVRRLFIVLEKAISRAAKSTLFEFNDTFTRAQFVNLVEPFLRDVQGRRGIYDFRVVCDESNNTGEVIDRNEFVGDIYIKPAKSINFIQLNFVAVRTGVDFEEIVGQF